MLISDILEISFFVFITYRIFRLLDYIAHPKLIRFVYSYIGLLILAHTLFLPALKGALLYAIPTLTITLFFCIKDRINQDLTFHTTHTPQKEWPEVLVRILLKAMVSKKNTYCIIECSSPLYNYLISEHILNIPLNETMVEFLIASQLYNQEQILWITSHGILVGINTHWHKTHTLFASESTNDWNYHSQLLSNTTDAICIHVNAETHTFTLTVHNKRYDTIKASQILSLLKKHLTSKKNIFSYQGSTNDIRIHKKHHPTNLS